MEVLTGSCLLVKIEGMKEWWSGSTKLPGLKEDLLSGAAGQKASLMTSDFSFSLITFQDWKRIILC